MTTTKAPTKIYCGTTDDLGAVRRHLEIGGTAELHSLDVTLTVHTRTNVWLEDGEVVHGHPTDRGTCLAPDAATYTLYR